MDASIVISTFSSRLQEYLAEGGAIALAFEGPSTEPVRTLQQKLEGLKSGEIQYSETKMASIRDGCYELEDALDELALEVRSSSSRRRRRSTGGFRGVVGRCVRSIIAAIHSKSTDDDSATALKRLKVEDLINTLIRIIVNSPESSLPNFYFEEVSMYRFIDHDPLLFREVYRRLQDGRALQPLLTPVNEIVGFDHDVDCIVNFLVYRGERSQSRQIISVTGPGGSGKTTLALLVYTNSTIRASFEAFAWVTVSMVSPRKTSVFKDILVQLVPGLGQENIDQFPDITLTETLFQVLKSEKCLIVLDDFSSYSSFRVWETLRFAFAYQNTSSRLLVTTRDQDSARVLGGEVHEVGPLTLDESWELFASRAFAHQDDSIGSIREIGWEIIDKCERRPLVVIMLANLLASTASPSHWASVSRHIYWYMNDGLYSGAKEVLDMSYKDSPDDVKRWFRYLGTFPENSEIEAETLFLLWKVEGILPSAGTGEETLIEIGNKCLDGLSSRSQDYGEGVPTLRRHKSCMLHNVAHQFCSSELKDSGFIEVMDLTRSNGPSQAFPLNFTRTTRRLAVHLDPQYELDGYPDVGKEKILCALETAEYLRSLLFINPNGQQQYMLWPELNLEVFRLLRVLGFEGCSFQTNPTLLPRGIPKLIFLKYFSVGGCHLEELPSSVGNLLYLETLDLQVKPSCKMTIPDILWKLERLMHLYLPVAFEAQGGGKLRFAGLNKLQILKNFDTRICHAQHLLELVNIRFLDAITSGSDEDLRVMIELIKKSSGSMREITLDVRKLDSYWSKRRAVLTELFDCSGLHTLSIDGYIGELPLMNFSGLTTLSFCGSELDRNAIAKIGELPDLYVLVLRNAAFVGRDIVISGSSFPQLRRLQLSGLHNLETLTIEEGTMPNLTALSIERCKSLKVSRALRDLYWLGVLHVAGMPIGFRNWLRQVERNSETSQSSAMMATRDDLLFPEANYQYSTV